MTQWPISEMSFRFSRKCPIKFHSPALGQCVQTCTGIDNGAKILRTPSWSQIRSCWQRKSCWTVNLLCVFEVFTTKFSTFRCSFSLIKLWVDSKKVHCCQSIDVLNLSFNTFFNELDRPRDAVQLMPHTSKPDTRFSWSGGKKPPSEICFLRRVSNSQKGGSAEFTDVHADVAISAMLISVLLASLHSRQTQDFDFLSHTKNVALFHASFTQKSLMCSLALSNYVGHFVFCKGTFSKI